MLSARFGEYTLYALEGDQFMLDGGAMFGVVPKPLWSRKIPADEQNRIAMCARLLLIHSHKTDRLYLIDTGMAPNSTPNWRKSTTSVNLQVHCRIRS